MAQCKLRFHEFELILEGNEEWIKEQLSKRQTGLALLLATELGLSGAETPEKLMAFSGIAKGVQPEQFGEQLRKLFEP